MAYRINNNCICCGECVALCPLEAIMGGEDKYYIEEDICDECDNCREVCPVDAIEKNIRPEGGFSP